MAPTFDVIVVGAGYIGCSAAYYLTRAGLKTALVDQAGIGSGASRANFGNIQVVDCELEHSIPMIKTAYTRFEHLEQELEADFNRRHLGCLLLIENEKQWQLMTDRLIVVRQSHIDAELLTSTDLLKLEPLIDPGSVLGALYSPISAQVYPFAFMWAFIKRACRLGLTIYLETTMTGFNTKNDQLNGIKTSHGDIGAGWVVLTTGAWTRQLGRMIGMDWPVHYIHGQAFATEPIDFQFNNHFSSAAFFEEAHETSQVDASTVTMAMAQSVHGNLLLGEAVRHVTDYNTRVTSEAPAAIACQAGHFFPSLRNLRILRTWAAPVAYTDDGLPFFGPVAGLKGLILATAFLSTVIITPLAGETVTRLVTGEQLELDISSFSPDRFL